MIIMCFLAFAIYKVPSHTFHLILARQALFLRFREDKELAPGHTDGGVNGAGDSEAGGCNGLQISDKDCVASKLIFSSSTKYCFLA